MSKSYKPISSKYISTTGIMHNHTLLSTFLDNLFPVGSVVIRADNKNPNTLYGGTWSKIASGRCLWGASSDSELNTTANSGLPNITGYFDPRWVDDSGGGIMMYAQAFTNSALYTSRPSDHRYWWAAITSSGNAGVNTQYHTRLHLDASKCNSIYGASTIVRPPQYKVYFWRRTA